MAELSDQLLVVAIMAYLAAMVCHAAEFAFGDRGVIGRAAARPARELVTAGGARAAARARSSTKVARIRPPGGSWPPRSRSWARRRGPRWPGGPPSR